MNVNLDAVTFNIKRASWTSFPELTIEFEEWQRLTMDGNTHIEIRGRDIQLQRWRATQYMIDAAKELRDFPDPVASYLLTLAASDQ